MAGIGAIPGALDGERRPYEWSVEGSGQRSGERRWRVVVFVLLVAVAPLAVWHEQRSAHAELAPTQHLRLLLAAAKLDATRHGGRFDAIRVGRVLEGLTSRTGMYPVEAGSADGSSRVSYTVSSDGRELTLVSEATGECLAALAEFPGVRLLRNASDDMRIWFGRFAPSDRKAFSNDCNAGALAGGTQAPRPPTQ